MIILINTDHNSKGSHEFTAPFTALLTEKLARYNEEIKKVEVHFTDENGRKTGADDKKCLLQAHVEKMDAIVATNHGDTYELALQGAIENLKASLDKKLGRLKDRKIAM